MDSSNYIFCKWKSRLWPAKVLTKCELPLCEDSKLAVEIFEVHEQTSVKSSDAKPFENVELQKISDNLDRSENVEVTEIELSYRSALRTAMSLLKKKQSETTSEACAESVKGENECTLSEEKGTSDSTMASAKLKVQKHTQVKGERRKRAEYKSKAQGFTGGVKSAPQKESTDSSNQDGHKTEKEKNSVRRLRSSSKEMDTLISPDQVEGNTRKTHRRTKRLVSQSIKKDNGPMATAVQQSGSDTEEAVSHKKRKYNQLPLPDFSFTEPDVLSSELSMECSSPESSTMPNVWSKDDTEEDLQLPVIDLGKEPACFECGAFVWCKFQRYPYWPSLVKSIRNKEKRAAIVFVEECLSDPDSQRQSFAVSLRTLKHYDCPEKKELLDIARKDYGKSIDWCDALICDYRIRLGCGSFSGSFFEYCTSAISNPVRRECRGTKLNFPTTSPEMHDTKPGIEESYSCVKNKILPDRERASRDRANEKLVDCIVRHKKAESHLISILSEKKKSSWLKKFQSGLQCRETYIEDEEQVEMVVGYLRRLCNQSSSQSTKLMNGDQTKFIFEVMLPEAVIFAISATGGLSYDKAEKKFLDGPLLSKRERKRFEKQILDKKKNKLVENL